MEANNVKVIFTKITEIKEADINVKDHDLGAIHESMNRFGFTSPLLLNEKTGQLVAGHGRLQALLQKKQLKEEAPANIKVDDNDDWYVPVIRGVSFKNEQEAQAYLIADNRLTELGGWNNDELVKELEKLAEESSLDGTGFDLSNMQELYDDLQQGVEEAAESIPTTKLKYEIEFDDETQQAIFFEFIAWLKKNYDGETVGERLYQHIELCLGD
mgnify:FL=1|tara:strand:- start:242 stop:883 length:642 start_codon:yes stop_codon:yes gene_type:complete